jgi:hypothetical protein
MLTDATKWRSRYSRLYKAVNRDGIPSFFVPKQITKSPIMITCESQEAKANWYFAGNLTIFSDLGVLNDVQLARQALPINRPILIDMPKADEGLIYKIAFKPAPWHIELSFTLWEFIG